MIYLAPGRPGALHPNVSQHPSVSTGNLVRLRLPREPANAFL